ncbi:MAG TPA: HGxxPAAW family protein [Cellulomonas sp.]
MVDQHVDAPATAVQRTVLGAGAVPAGVPPVNEGKTVAAWTTVAIVLVGAVISALGVAFGQPWLAWTGGGVIVVGLIVGGVLRAAGHGQPKRPTAR